MRALVWLALGAIVVLENGAAVAQDAPAYDPTPFLSSMVTLRSAAVTCDPFLGNEPGRRTTEIVSFFEALKQQLPQMADTVTQASLSRFVPSQAAVLCRDKMNVAMSGYMAQAQVYRANKPDDWPEPPSVPGSAWCSSENCLEY